MNNENKRVLGRVLAIEETVSVSGAAPTTPCRDQLTSATSDTSLRMDCVTTSRSADTGTVVDSTGPVLDSDS